MQAGLYGPVNQFLWIFLIQICTTFLIFTCSKTSFGLAVNFISGKRRTEAWWNRALFTINRRRKYYHSRYSSWKSRYLPLSQEFFGLGFGLLGFFSWKSDIGPFSRKLHIKVPLSSAASCLPIVPPASRNICSQVAAPIWSIGRDCHPPQTAACHFVIAVAGASAWHRYVLYSLLLRAQVRRAVGGRGSHWCCSCSCDHLMATAALQLTDPANEAQPSSWQWKALGSSSSARSLPGSRTLCKRSGSFVLLWRLVSAIYFHVIRFRTILLEILIITVVINS